MSKENFNIVRDALAAHTPEEASDVQLMIKMSFGDEYLRPLGDKVNNYGTLASGADYDLKLVEAVTNMQDAVVERAALLKYGSRESAGKALKDPRSAAVELLGDVATKDLPDRATVTFYESDPPTEKSKKLTAVFRDQGTGISNAQVPKTIFGLGGSYKEDAMYLQGAFGLGGELTYRNAEFVILVTRKDPALLGDGEEDVITVAVVEWRRLTKVESAYYLVDREWNEAGDVAYPWSCPSADFPDFEPGTHLALISYRTTGLYRQREGDARSFDTIVNTRLIRPILPVRWRNFLSRGDQRATNLRGLESRLDNTDFDFPRESAAVPFVYEGKTYMLDVSYTLFSEPSEKGKRASFVAYNHAVVFTSNGQVQTHWTPAEFRARTKQKKLDQRILIEVNLDALPISARTSLFTADRSETVKSELALRLDEQIVEWINTWDSLSDQNRMALEQQLKSATSVSTRGVSDRIRRAFAVRGFGSATSAGGVAGGAGGGTKSGGSHGGKPKTIQLNADPTLIDGPSSLQLVIGKTKFVGFTVDAEDSFFDSGRGTISAFATGDLPFEIADVVAIGKPSRGRFRISFGIPDGLEESTFGFTLQLIDWTRAAGGLGDPIFFGCQVSLVDSIPGTGEGKGSKPTGGKGTQGTSEGSNVVLLWDDPGGRTDWTPNTVGVVEDVEAQTIAKVSKEYEDLLALGDAQVQCIVLNREYGPLANYLETRAKDIKTASIEENKARYAIGVGVEMLVLDDEYSKLEKKGNPLPAALFIDSAYRAAARGVLAVLPEFDKLATVYEEGLE